MPKKVNTGSTKLPLPIRLKQYTPPAQIKQTLHIQPGVTYAQITKQNSYAAINIEQDQHINQSDQQTSDIQDLKNMMKRLFEQMGTMLNLLTTVLPKLK
jgi:lipopolysaccharide/colanic/teichoic acid biosynthesis glycosyltransferase